MTATMAERVTSRRAAAAIAGVTPSTISQWVAKGWLATPPWTREDLHTASTHGVRRRSHGSAAPHGSPSRFDAGCNCDKCTAAHYRQISEDNDTRRQAEWDAGPAEALITSVAAGVDYRQALAAAGVSSQAVTGHRKRDPAFATALDQALMAGRDPNLSHGTAEAWKMRCRCPECRTWHNAHR